MISVYKLSQIIPKVHMQNIGHLSDYACQVPLLNFRHFGHRNDC